ncbi:MAG: hypothetical protein L0338_24535 [Acidobacteria bacterium]|nr:hypothetical protein [Acidobacteriota bacterium]
MARFDEGELVRESEWMRVYQIGPKHHRYVSKFLSDGLKMSAESIRSRWASMTRVEQEDFALAFSAKPVITPEDQEILTFLMECGSEIIWSRIAVRLREHSQRERVLSFLMDRVERLEGLVGNYVQALELIGDKRAVPCLRQLYDHYREQTVTSRRSKTSLADWHEFMTVYDYLICCRTLFKLEGNSEFKAAIEELLMHPGRARPT